jgi:hypothetical protein
LGKKLEDNSVGGNAQIEPGSPGIAAVKSGKWNLNEWRGTKQVGIPLVNEWSENMFYRHNCNWQR